MKTFIRAVEHWVPGVDRRLLEWGGGLYGECRRLAAASHGLCFGRGEGLPRQACDAGQPLVERGQGRVGSTFATVAPALSVAAGLEPEVGPGAAAAGLQSLVAIPVLDGGRLQATVAWRF